MDKQIINLCRGSYGLYERFICVFCSEDWKSIVQCSFSLKYVHTYKQILYTRVLGSFAQIFYFNCEHFLCVWCIHSNAKTNKKCRGFSKQNFVDFLNLMIIELCWRLIFEILIIHKPFLGSCEVPHKIWADKTTSKLYILIQGVPRNMTEASRFENRLWSLDLFVTFSR